MSETTIKYSLKSILKEYIRERFISLINELSHSFTIVLAHASRLFNLYLMKAYELDIKPELEQSVFYQCINLFNLKGRAKIPILLQQAYNEVYNNFKVNFDWKYTGDIISAFSKQYLTVFMNSIWMNIESRVKYFIRERTNFNKQQLYDINKYLLYQENLTLLYSSEQHQTIENLKSELSDFIPPNLQYHTRQLRWKELVSLTHYILLHRDYSKDKVKRFNLAPHYDNDLKNILISNTVLKLSILKKLKLTGGWETIIKPKYFKSGRNKVFDNYIATDGLSVSLLYKDKTKKVKKETDKLLVRETWEQKEQTKQKIVQQINTLAQSGPVQVMGIDPGRSNLLSVYYGKYSLLERLTDEVPDLSHFIETQSHKKYKASSFVYSTKRYYQDTKIKSRTVKANTRIRRQVLEDEKKGEYKVSLLNPPTSKVHTSALYSEYLKVLILDRVIERSVQHNEVKRKYKWKGYIQKQQIQDLLIDTVAQPWGKTQDQQKRTIILYGNGMIGHGGFAPGPNKAFLQRLKRSSKCTVIETPEHYTTLKGNCCGKVIKKIEKSQMRVCQCPHCNKYLNRDVNASINILKAGLFNPDYLKCREDTNTTLTLSTGR